MTAESWLVAGTADAPSRLIEEMMAAVRQQKDGPIPDRLAEAAMTLLARVLEGDGGRDDALPLLAADALLTHAFQAQAELAPEDLGRFARDWSGGERLARILP